MNWPDPEVVTDPVIRRRLRDRWRSVEAMRRTGRMMIAVGLVGALLAIVGTVSGWVFVGQLGSATNDSLEVTIETLDAVDDTIDLADDVVGSTTQAVDALAGTLDAVSSSFDTGTTAIVDVADLAGTIGPSVEEATRAVRSLERVGSDIDGVLGALSNIPFGPDYDPSAGLGETFAAVADALDPVPAQLDTTAQSLIDFTDSAGELQIELDRLTSSVKTVSADLAESDALVSQYRTNVDDARTLATSTQADLADNVRLMRVLIVIAGLTFAVSQIVPLWMGRSLLDEAEAAAAPADVPALDHLDDPV